jgi:hypothetical protein
MIRSVRSQVAVAGMDKDMIQTTREKVLAKLRRRYETPARNINGSCWTKPCSCWTITGNAAIRVLRQRPRPRGPVILAGRPVKFESERLLPWLRPIWQATDYACGQRLVAMRPEWIPAYEQHERRLPGEVREKLLLASAEVSVATKARLRQKKTELNPFALKRTVTKSLKEIEVMRRRPHPK